MVRVTRAVAEARLGDVEEGKRFWCRDGRYLKNLGELEAALKEMPEETYRYHVNEIKSDFSSWVMDVIGDGKLSRDLQKCAGPAQAAKSVADRLEWLKSK